MGQTDKVLVRKIPEDVMAAMTQLATLHDRSLEAEVRHAMRVYVKPYLTSKERSSRAKVLAERLQFLLDQDTEVQYKRHVEARKFSISEFAQQVGMEFVTEVEDWFLGAREASFSQLAKVALYFSASPEWLMHGIGEPYRPYSFIVNPNLSEKNTLQSITYAMESLPTLGLVLQNRIIKLDDYCLDTKTLINATKTEDEDQQRAVVAAINDPICALHVFREASPEGRVVFVVNRNQLICSIVPNFSMGEADLQNPIVQAFFEGSRKWLEIPICTIRSHTLNATEFDALLRGLKHPMALVNPDPWIDGFVKQRKET